MADKKPRKRREAFKKAPPGYYNAQDAMKRLQMNSSTFYYHVRNGKIPRVIPPLRKEGFYPKKEIDVLANQLELALYIEETTGKEVQVAHPEDAQGIVDVLHSLGWQCATAEQYRSWWKVNPLIHFVIRDQGVVLGNIACVPYTPETLAARMAGYKRAWHVEPKDILPYHKGFFDTYVGGEVRQDIPYPKHVAAHLIAGFRSFLEDLAAQGIMIHHMNAMSAEVDGQKLCRSIGFIERPNEEGEMPFFVEGKPIIRFVLDLRTSNAPFAKRYRKAWRKQ